jgi:hypothetical protein
MMEHVDFFVSYRGEVVRVFPRKMRKYIEARPFHAVNALMRLCFDSDVSVVDCRRRCLAFYFAPDIRTSEVETGGDLWPELN